MPKISIRTAVIYLTERCPLACGYCYFRDKKQQDIPWQVLTDFLVFVKREWGSPRSFMISGGEPLLCWDKVTRLVVSLRRGFPRAGIHMQTNGLLLDRTKTAWLRGKEVSLEFGIDGDFGTTARWRSPMDLKMFNRLVRHIRAAIAAGISCGCTMTVHPAEVALMAGNLRFLQEVGLSCVDITPAAFMPWNKAHQAAFKKGYKDIAADPALRRMLFTREDHELMPAGLVDISLHPPGEVLLGDAYLCLPEKVRKKFSLWDPGTGALDPAMAAYYWRQYALLWKRPSWRTYRDHVSFGFEMVNSMMGRNYLNVRQIVPLMRFMTRMHLSYGHEKTSH